MRLFKPIIALFLLLTYSFAFAVELVPHCHIDNHVEYFGFKDGKNHQHVSPENKDADDVVHKNHLDDSLLDFVICLLNELEHPESDIFHQHVVVSELNNVNSKALSKTKIIAFLSAVLIKPITVKTNKEFNSYFYSSNNYQSILLESSPHRGPPVFSC
ncbi:MAG: hypothetical protein H6587_07130 [Flavobacteriales bacterium]|nr:hypothetical protein [Flavobacteriales bacterium]